MIEGTLKLDIQQRLAWEIEQLHKRYGGLPSADEASDVWPRIWYEEAHNSTAIEGNTLALQEVEVLLRDGRALGSKEMKDYLEVEGYAQAAQWVYDQALASDWQSGKLLSLFEVRHVHELAMHRVWDDAPHPSALAEEAPGNWRRHNIQAFPGGMRPPEWTEVPALMTDWVARVNEAVGTSARVAETVAQCHAEFERIHPFLDGNGRAGRLLMNLMLVRRGYPPAIIYKRDRTRYLRALDAVDKRNSRPLANMVARAVLDNLYRFVVPAVAGPARLVSLEALARRGRTAGALRKAVERGRLRATRSELGTWLSTRQWIEEYEKGLYGREVRPRPAAPSRRRTSVRPFVEASQVIPPSDSFPDLARKSLAVRLTNLGREPARATLAHLHHPQLLFKRDGWLKDAEAALASNPDLRGQGVVRTLQAAQSMDACFYLEEVSGRELQQLAWLFVQYADLRGQLWLTTVPLRLGGQLSYPHGQIAITVLAQQLEIRPISRAYLHEDRVLPDAELLKGLTPKG